MCYNIKRELKEMPIDDAFQKALKDMQGLSPYVTAAKSSADYSDGKFKVRFFNRTFLIHYPEVKVEEEGSEQPPERWLQVLLLHYLVTADGVPVSGMWVAYRHLPGTRLFERRFVQMVTTPLVRAFGNDIEGFRKASLSLGGKPMSRTGDAAFRFLALPKISMACILYLGDEEMSPSVNVLFDAAAPHYLPTEDLSLVGSYLSRQMQRYKSQLTGNP